MTKQDETSSTDQAEWLEIPEWLGILSRANTDIFLFDLDGTVWGDILVILNEEFGPTDPDGEKRWKKHDRAFKVHGTMTNGAHLEAEYRDLLEAQDIDSMIAWLKENHKLIPGIKGCLDLLKESGVTPIAVSNGSVQIAQPMLEFHGIEMPLVANSLLFSPDGAFERMEFVHNEHDGVRKGDLARVANLHGHRVIGCAGDSKGDICLAEATADLDGLILACGDDGLTSWCLENEGKVVKPNGWLSFTDYADVNHALQARLGGG